MSLSPTTEKEDDGSVLSAHVENFTLGIVVKTKQILYFQLHMETNFGTDSL